MTGPDEVPGEPYAADRHQFRCGYNGSCCGSPRNHAGEEVGRKGAAGAKDLNLLPLMGRSLGPEVSCATPPPPSSYSPEALSKVRVPPYHVGQTSDLAHRSFPIPTECKLVRLRR